LVLPVAYHLARRGVRATVLEKGDMASGSSGACDGLVLLQSKRPGIHLRLAMESRKLFNRLSEELPVSIEYRCSGGMVVIETAEEFRAMERYAEEQKETGLEVALLDIAGARRMEPELSESLAGAAYSPPGRAGESHCPDPWFGSGRQGPGGRAYGPTPK